MRTVAYLRISEDKTGQRAGVERQERDCRALAEQHGWEISEVLVDNDVSASTGRVRPAFEQLLASHPGRIVVWHTDRLIRRMDDLERVIALGVNVHAVQAGHLDLSNPGGRMVARQLTAVAAYEGEHKAARQRASNRQRAERGISLWTRRPFGFDRDGSEVRVVEHEAAEIRKAADAVLAGATLASIRDDLDARGVPTSTGGRWSLPTVKRVLLNPRNVGRVIYNGEDFGTGDGPRILDDETFDRLTAVLTDPRRRTAPSTQVKHLLSGLVRCGRCDVPMFATNTATKRTPKYGVYRCKGCCRVRRREYVDEVVEAVVVARLSRPDAARLLSTEVDVAELQRQVTELRDRRDGLAGLLADGLLGVEDVRERATKIKGEIAEVERQIEAAGGRSPLAPLVGVEDVEAAWRELDILVKRAVIDTLMTIHVEAAGKGGRFDPEQVRITWRKA